MYYKKIFPRILFSLLLVGTFDRTYSFELTNSTKLKVAASAIVSGVVGNSIAVSLTKLGSFDLNVSAHYKCLGVSWTARNLNSKLVNSIATVASALIGGGVSYYYFTPEGEIVSDSKEDNVNRSRFIKFNKKLS